MNWNDIKDQVGKFAPLLGGALGGPGGAAIGALVAKGLGVENNPVAVMDAIKSDPNAAIKLQQIQNENEQHIREYLWKTLDIELKDKANAREINKNNPMPMIICILLTIMTGTGAYLLFTMEIPETNREIAYLLFGTLLAKWGDSIAYWVGTTRSSMEKTKYSMIKS